MNTTFDQQLERIAAVCPATNKLDRAELFDLVRAVEVLVVERPSPDQLWTLGRLSTYLGLDPMLTEHLMEQPGAPQPFDENIWRAADIYRWLDAHGRASLKAVAAR